APIEVRIVDHVAGCWILSAAGRDADAIRQAKRVAGEWRSLANRLDEAIDLTVEQRQREKAAFGEVPFRREVVGVGADGFQEWIARGDGAVRSRHRDRRIGVEGAQTRA